MITYEQELQNWVNKSENKFIKKIRIAWQKDSLRRTANFRKKHNICK